MTAGLHEQVTEAATLCERVLAVLQQYRVLHMAAVFHGHVTEAATLCERVSAVRKRYSGARDSCYACSLQVTEAATLCEWVLAVLKKYSSAHAGMRSVAMAAAVREGDKEDAYRDLRALLRLLTHLAQRDLLDYSGEANGPSVDVAGVCAGFQLHGGGFCMQGVPCVALHACEPACLRA